MRNIRVLKCLGTIFYPSSMRFLPLSLTFSWYWIGTFVVPKAMFGPVWCLVSVHLICPSNDSLYPSCDQLLKRWWLRFGQNGLISSERLIVLS
jgi:hypothetical protein